VDSRKSSAAGVEELRFGKGVLEQSERPPLRILSKVDTWCYLRSIVIDSRSINRNVIPAVARNRGPLIGAP